jgi:hypothetical protein
MPENIRLSTPCSHPPSAAQTRQCPRRLSPAQVSQLMGSGQRWCLLGGKGGRGKRAVCRISEVGLGIIVHVTAMGSTLMW